MENTDKQNAKLLGDGEDLTGRSVDYWGETWVVTGKNYLGDWDVERFEDRDSGRVKISSSISSFIMNEDHPHFASLIDIPVSDINLTGAIGRCIR